MNAGTAEAVARHGHAVRLRLVATVRSMVDQLATSTAGDAALARADAAAGEAVRVLSGGDHRPGYVRSAEGELTGLGPHGELGPFTGAMHVFAPPVDVEAVGDGPDRRVNGSVTYGNAYEGAPGMLQGGFILATFDEILGLAQSGSGRMTARLDISYRSPAYLHRVLRYTAWVDRIDGRKAFVAGALHDGDRLCAEATGLFIAPRPAG